MQVAPFTEVTPTQVSKEDIRNLIDLKPFNPKLNKLSMSFTGYQAMSQKDCNVIQNYIRWVGDSCKAKAVDMIYTFPKEVSVLGAKKSGKKISPKGFVTYKTQLFDEYDELVLDAKGKPKMESPRSSSAAISGL